VKQLRKGRGTLETIKAIRCLLGKLEADMEVHRQKFSVPI
jgi:hypothetical protein